MTKSERNHKLINSEIVIDTHNLMLEQLRQFIYGMNCILQEVYDLENYETKNYMKDLLGCFLKRALQQKNILKRATNIPSLEKFEWNILKIYN